MPPHFSQDSMDFLNCVIYYEDGREKNVKPEECIGLEGPGVWNEKGVIQRLEDHYAGKINPYVELYKVILSEDDPRYKNPNVRWDFKEQKFVRN